MLASIAARNATLIPSGVRTQAASHATVCKDREYFLYCKILHMIICKIYYYSIASLSLIAVLKYTANPKYD